MAGLREYFQQTFEERLMGSLPDEVLSQPTPATQLLMRKQEMDQVEAALSAQKEVRAACCLLPAPLPHRSPVPRPCGALSRLVLVMCLYVCVCVCVCVCVVCVCA